MFPHSACAKCGLVLACLSVPAYLHSCQSTGIRTVRNEILNRKLSRSAEKGIFIRSTVCVVWFLQTGEVFQYKSIIETEKEPI